MVDDDPAPVRAPSQAPSPDRTVGLVLIHGIGEQKQGDTLSKLQKGLNRISIETTSDLSVDHSTDEPLVFHTKEASVRVYEVTWSDILSEFDYGAFEIEMMTEVIWFPVVHRWQQSKRPTLWILSKSALLAIAAGLVELLHWALSTPFGWWQKLAWTRRRMSGVDAGIDDAYSDVIWTQPTVENLARAGFIPRRSVVSRLLDRYLGDVYSYTASAIALRWLPNSREAEPARRILKRVDEKVQLALSEDEGCTEIHILAHSLGSVIAYHYLTGLDRRSEDASTFLPITTLHSIGSPIEKIRYFWPSLAFDPGDLPLRTTSLAWSNFVNPFDVVSERIRHDGPWQPVFNHVVLQGGVVRSHTLYEENNRFLGHLTQSLFGKRYAGRRHPLRFLAGVLGAFSEAVFLILGIVVLLVLGFVVFSAVFLASLASIWLYAELLSLAGWDVLGANIQQVAVWVNIVLVGVLVIVRKFVVDPMAAQERYQLLNSPSDPDT